MGERGIDLAIPWSAVLCFMTRPLAIHPHIQVIYEPNNENEKNILNQPMPLVTQVLARGERRRPRHGLRTSSHITAAMAFSEDDIELDSYTGR